MYKPSLSLSALLLFTMVSLGIVPLTAPSTQAIMFEPSGEKAPQKATGGASRQGDECLRPGEATTASFQPVIPSTNLGLTLADRPTVFIYLPQTMAQNAFLSLQDEAGNLHYRTRVPLPQKHGILAMKLPAEAPPLQIGKNYQWSVALICGEQLEPDSPEVNGWIRRVEGQTSLSHSSQSEPSLKSVSALASSGLWYDTLSALAQLRQTQPENSTLTTHWVELLTSVGLETISTEPLTLVD